MTRPGWSNAILVLFAAVSVVAARGTARPVTAAVLLVAVVALLAASRQPPGAGVAAVLLVAAAAAGLAGMVAAPAGVAEIPVLYAVARLPRRLDGTRLRVVIGVIAVAFAAAVGWDTSSPLGALAGLGVPLLAQRSVEQQQLQAERDRAVTLLAEVEASRDDVTRAAIVGERNRIAGEMHDVLGHSLAGLSLQLQAVRAQATKLGVDARVTGPLDRAAALARDGIREAHAVVGTLREPVELDVDALPLLVARFPGSVRLRSEGRPVPLPAAAGHGLYRAVQEALTNAARYAPGGAVDVRLTWSADGLAVEVSDAGPAPGQTPMRQGGGGSGLSGMAERLRAAGGSLTAGPRPGGAGWSVELRVPAAEVGGGDVATGRAAPGAGGAG